MSEEETPKQPVEEKAVSHADSSVGGILSGLTFLVYGIALWKLPGLAPEQKWVFGLISAAIAFIACAFALSIAYRLMKFLADLLLAIFFAVNLGAVFFILFGAFGHLGLVEAAGKQHFMQASLHLAMLFGADLMVAILLLSSSRVKKILKV